jgi:hypothetical protein
MSDVRHVLGISGGKDSAALAIYLRTRFPELAIEYYFMDTGKELDETYEFIDGLEVFLGQKIERLQAASGSPMAPFDHFLETYGGYLPSPNARWCTRKLKLEPFERFFVGDDPALSYVAIRADEDREGLISHKANIQTIFPFRRNMWTQDVMNLVFDPQQTEHLGEIYAEVSPAPVRDTVLEIVRRPVGTKFSMPRKVNMLLDLSVPIFNHAVFAFLRHSKYPISELAVYPLLDKEDIVDRDGVFRLLEESGVGKPKYYEPIGIEVDGKKGFYNRSRSGCFFCFFQQKIEWVWLREQHPDRFLEAIAYEKNGFTWMDDERLDELILPGRIEEIKKSHLSQKPGTGTKSSYLVDVLAESEGQGCTICFI